MGRRGPVPKDVVTGHRKPQPKTVLAVPPPRSPEPAEEWLDLTKERWAEFWVSPISSVVQEPEIAIVERLFQYRDQHARASEIVRTSPIVKGSVGQVRMNPLADYVSKLENAMLKLETELGLTPMARQRLGYAYGEAAKSLTDMMQSDELAQKRREERARRLADG